jgi:kexin
MLAGPVTSLQESKALTYRLDINNIYSCSWGPSDDGKTLEGPDRTILKSMLEGILYGRDGRGALYIFAAGNGGSIDNCNMDGFANSPLTITIGAVTHNDRWPQYMEWCAAMLAVTYSSDETLSIVRSSLDYFAWLIFRSS